MTDLRKQLEVLVAKWELRGSNFYGDPETADLLRELKEDLGALLVVSEPKEVGRGVRPKYVDEHFPRWMKFGGWMEPNPKVGDVADTSQDIVNSVSEEVADKLIKAREEFVDQLQEIFDEHPDQFNVYGPPLK